MPRKPQKIPPRIVPLNPTDYVVFSFSEGFYNVAFYRPYKLGEDGLTNPEDCAKIHKRFAVRNRSLLDSLRIVLGEGSEDHDPDMTEFHIRKTHPQALPGNPGEEQRDPEYWTEKEEENSAANSLP